MRKSAFLALLAVIAALLLSVEGRGAPRVDRTKHVRAEKVAKGFVRARLIIASRQIDQLDKADAKAAELAADLHDLLWTVDNAFFDRVAWEAMADGSGDVALARKLRKSATRHDQLASKAHGLAKQLVQAEKKVDRVHKQLSSQVKRSLSNRAVDLSGPLAVALATVHIEFRRSAYSFPPRSDDVPDDLVNPRECAGDIVRDRVLWRLFRAATSRDLDDVAQYTMTWQRLLSCATSLRLWGYNAALGEALAAFDRDWGAQRTLADKGREILIQPAFQILDLSNHMGKTATFEWFEVHRKRLTDTLAAGEARLLGELGLLVYDHYGGSLMRVLPGCRSAVPNPQQVQDIEWSAKPDKRGCGGLVDFIDSIANPRAWGIGGCRGADLLHNGPRTPDPSPSGSLRKPSSTIPPIGGPPDAMPTPKFGCDHGCQGTKNGGLPSWAKTQTPGGTSPGSQRGLPTDFKSPFQLNAKKTGTTPFGESLNSFSKGCSSHHRSGSRSGGRARGGGAGPQAIGCLLAAAQDPHRQCLESGIAKRRSQAKPTGVKMHGQSVGCSLSKGGKNKKKKKKKNPGTKRQKKKKKKAADQANKQAKKDKKKVNKALKQFNLLVKKANGKIVKVAVKAADLAAAKKAVQDAEIVDAKDSRLKGKDAQTIINSNGKIKVLISKQALQNGSQKDLNALARHEQGHAMIGKAAHRAGGKAGMISARGGTQDLAHRIMDAAGYDHDFPDSGGKIFHQCLDESSCGCSGGDSMMSAYISCMGSPQDQQLRNQGQRRPGNVWGNIDPLPDSGSPTSIGSMDVLECMMGAHGPVGPVSLKKKSAQAIKCSMIQCPANAVASSGGVCGCGGSSNKRVQKLHGGGKWTIDCLDGKPTCTGPVCTCSGTTLEGPKKKIPEAPKQVIEKPVPKRLPGQSPSPIKKLPPG